MNHFTKFHTKACVCYFHVFHQKKALEKIFYFTRKLYLFFSYSNFVLLCSPKVSHAGSRRSLLKVNTKVYDITTSLNQNLKTQTVQYLLSKEFLILKLVQLIQYYYKKYFIGKNMSKKCIPTSSKLLFDFGRNIANVFKKIVHK